MSGTLTVLISTLQSFHENLLCRSFNVNLTTLLYLLIKRGDRQDKGDQSDISFSTTQVINKAIMEKYKTINHFLLYKLSSFILSAYKASENVLKNSKNAYRIFSFSLTIHKGLGGVHFFIPSHPPDIYRGIRFYDSICFSLERMRPLFTDKLKTNF